MAVIKRKTPSLHRRARLLPPVVHLCTDARPATQLLTVPGPHGLRRHTIAAQHKKDEALHAKDEGM
jgi:hypothetical protein